MAASKILALSIAGAIMVAGCGTVSHVSAPAGDGASQHKAEKSPPSTRSQARPSSSSLHSTAHPTGHSVELQALHYVASRTSLPLGAPTVLPRLPSPSGYWAGQVQASQMSWTVHLMETAEPYQINSAKIPHHLIDAPQSCAVPTAVASFGIMSLHGSAPAVGTAQWTTFLWQESLISSGMNGNALGPLIPPNAQSEPVSLGDQTVGTWYQANAESGTLIWHEGDWTLAVEDSESSALKIARPVAVYLHKVSLPPYPGLVEIATGVHGVATRIDWVAQHALYHIDNDTVGEHNALRACQMGVSWQAYPAVRAGSH